MASVSIGPRVTTSGGNVEVKMWQKLPTEMLVALLRKQSRGGGRTPIYRRIGGGGGVGGARGCEDDGGGGGKRRGDGAGGGGGSSDKRFRYRLVLPDESDVRDRDVVLTPAHPVDNDEQAKEEAALLGLIYLFPDLPHERTLPEPYRTTYLAARALATAPPSSVTGAGGGGGRLGGEVVIAQDATASTTTGVGASANARLVAANVVVHRSSKVDDDDGGGGGGGTKNPAIVPTTTVLLTKAQVDEARRLRDVERRAKERRREAMLDANRPVDVFMSARFRRRIERCLFGGEEGGSGGAFNDEEDEEEEDVNDNDDDSPADDDAIRSYVVGRLTKEGFAPSHAHKAYRETKTTTTTREGKGKGGDAIITPPPTDDNDEGRSFEKAYEDALQYLCIRLGKARISLFRFNFKDKCP